MCDLLSGIRSAWIPQTTAEQFEITTDQFFSKVLGFSIPQTTTDQFEITTDQIIGRFLGFNLPQTRLKLPQTNFFAGF